MCALSASMKKHDGYTYAEKYFGSFVYDLIEDVTLKRFNQTQNPKSFLALLLISQAEQ